MYSLECSNDSLFLDSFPKLLIFSRILWDVSILAVEFWADKFSDILLCEFKHRLELSFWDDGLSQG